MYDVWRVSVIWKEEAGSLFDQAKWGSRLFFQTTGRWYLQELKDAKYSRKAKNTFKYSAKLVKTLMVHSQYNQTHIRVAATSTACKETRVQ